jgi:transposase
MYSKEFRGEVLAACDAGAGTREAATRFNVSESWVRRIKQQRREDGRVAPKTTRARKPKWSAFSDWLCDIVAKQPDIYLREIQAALRTEHNVEMAESTLSTACRALKLTRKKRR